MKIRRDIFSFRNRVVVIIVGVSLGMVSLLYTNNMAKRLKEKEQHDVALWAHAMERANRNVMGGSMEDPLITDIVSNGNNIPFIMTNENLEVLQFHLVPEKIIDHPDRLRRQIDNFTADQRFYLAYAALWAQNIRDEEIARLTKIDVHSLGKWRVNATLRNLQTFYDAFDITDGAMFMPEQERVIVW